ncbi:MAG: DUF134 domain-containing protein [Promethearchaeota archaeon]|nr:MAG: DUF134 domain-containing protein [Candidatus Lokiarchaeota archaeon]
MGRRTRRRWVGKPPDNFYFSRESPSMDANIILTVAEFEALRLKHYMNLNQEQASEWMGISQPTFSRVIERAHQKLTQALIEGKTIKVFGGEVDYKITFIGYGCADCDSEWEDRSASRDKKVKCIKCDSDNVYYLIREPI